MSTFNIIDTDDEIEYNEEDIRMLCQSEEDILDVDKIILKREKKEKRKIYENIDIINLVDDLEIGKNILDKYRLALKEKTPIELILQDNKGDLFSIKDRLNKSTDVLESLKYFKKEFSVGINEFIFSYYISNIYQSDKFIIDNLNKLKKISGVEFNKDEWSEKKKRFNTIYENRLKILEKDFKKIDNFYNEIDKLPFSNKPEKLNESFNLDKTKVKSNIKKERYYFDIDSGSIIFDELSVNKKFPYIQYNNYEEKFYKIFDKTLNLEDFLNTKDDLFSENEDEDVDNKNKIYIINRLELYNKYYHILLEIDLKESTLTFEYPYNTSYKIYEDLKKLIPGFNYRDEKILSLKGSFEINIDNYDEIKFYYLTLFDEKFSNFIYINESKRPRSLMKNIKYYYKNYKENYLESDFTISFYLEKLYINSYVVNFKSKVEKNNNISEFSLILSKLIYYYENYNFLETDLPLVINPYTGKDGDGLGDILKVEDLNLKNNIIKGNKLTNLISTAPEIFPVSEYGRKCLCPNQPIIIDDEDREDWSNYLDKGAISVFPPEKSMDKNKKKYTFACPTDGLVFNYIVNPDSKSPFPILPCCSQTVKNNYYLDYDLIKKDSEKYFNLKADQKVVFSKNILKTLNPLASNQRGNLPLVLKQFLNNIYQGVKFYRLGLNKNSQSSFFHCCIEASEHLELVSKKVTNKRYLKNLKFLIEIKKRYSGLDISERDILVDKLKSRIGNEQGIKINLEIISQELFNFDKDTINYLLESENFDSKYFYRLMEYLYFLNIFVFTFKDGNIKLEKPSHQYYHQREFRNGLPSILLIKHLDGELPVYEIIRHEDSALLDQSFLSYMKDYIDSKGYYISDYIDGRYKLTKNFFSNINWNILLKNYLIREQFINDSGRSYALNIQYNDKDIMTIFIPPSFPLDVPKGYKIYKTKKEVCLKLFGKNYSIGSEGMWYDINDLEKAVFIPIEGFKEKDSKICLPYITISKRSRGVNKIKKINTIKKNAKIIIQIILHIWNISKDTNLDDWFKYYIAKGDKKTINTFCNSNILIDYRFPKNLKTPEEVIDYYSEYIPSVFGKDVIFLYDELENAVYKYLQNYIYKTRGYQKISNKAIVDIFNTEIDFNQRLNNKLVVGEKNYDDWHNFLQAENKDFINLDNNLNTRKRGFLYKNKNGNIFIIQNNLQNSLKVSILTAKVWKKLKYNLGYYLTSINVWKHIIEDHRLLEALEINSQDIIQLANNHGKFLDVEFEDLYAALDFLYREKIEIELEESDYNYITLNYMEYINKENFKTTDPYNLFSYENEAYAAMLNIA